MIVDKHSKLVVESIVADRPDDRPVVFVDADNTLWDTDKIFADAQLELLSAVETVCKTQARESNRLNFIRSIDQELASRHHLGLRYPHRFLIKAISIMLQGKTASMAAREVWTGKSEGTKNSISSEKILALDESYLENLSKIPQLMPGVKSGLLETHARGARILILTEGHKNRVVKTAQTHGIMPLIDRVIEAPKNQRLFARVLHLMGKPPIAVMIGDQVGKDITPARQAGLHTIYIPGKFKPKWEEAEPECVSDFQLVSFAEVPSTIAYICNNNGTDKM